MEQSTARQIKNEVHEHREILLKWCRKLVEMETPSDHPATMQPAFAFLEQRFHELNFCTRIIPGNKSGGMLYARPRDRSDRQPRQLLIGHVDTVWPIGTLEDRPFQIESDQNRARGPGLFDMKAGLAQLIFSLNILQELHITPEFLPVVLINSDEEIGSPDSSRHIRRLARVSDRAYILEPALGPEGHIKTARKGVGRFTVDITGSSSHAGLTPEKGSSAITELSHVIQKLNALNKPDQGITVNVGVIEGGTRTNVIASSSRAEIDVRVRTQKQAEQLEQNIRNIESENPEITLDIEGGFNRPPMERTRQNEQLWTRVKTMGELLNLNLKQTRSGGGSDGNTTSQYTATVDGLGPVGGGAHESYEYIELDELQYRTALFCLLLLLE